jgi:hypothetical protein
MNDQEQKGVFNRGIDSTNETVLLEQYKLYVESANLTSRLRGQANSFYLALNTILVGFIGGIIEFSNQASIPLWIVFASLTGVLLDLSWFFIIRAYRSLNSGRFAVIHELEERLPARIYAREWELITRPRPNKSKYVRQTYVEQVVPIAFFLLHISLTATYILAN